MRMCCSWTEALLTNSGALVFIVDLLILSSFLEKEKRKMLLWWKLKQQKNKITVLLPLVVCKLPFETDSRWPQLRIPLFHGSCLEKSTRIQHSFEVEKWSVYLHSLKMCISLFFPKPVQIWSYSKIQDCFFLSVMSNAVNGYCLSVFQRQSIYLWWRKSRRRCHKAWQETAREACAALWPSPWVSWCHTSWRSLRLHDCLQHGLLPDPAEQEEYQWNCCSYC